MGFPIVIDKLAELRDLAHLKVAVLVETTIFNFALPFACHILQVLSIELNLLDFRLLDSQLPTL